MGCLGLGFLLGLTGYQALAAPTSLDWARLLADSGLWQEAKVVVERQRSHHADAESTLLLGRIFAGLGDFAASARCLAEVHGQSFRKPEALLREGQAWLAHGDGARAEAALKGCVEHADASASLRRAALRDLAAVFADEDRPDDLRAVLWSSHAIAGADEKAVILQELVNQKLLRLEPTVRAKRLEKFVATNPADVQAAVALGRAYVEANQLDKGLPILEKCAAANPEDATAWRGWLWALFQRGDFERLVLEIPRAPEALKEESGYWKVRATIAQQNRQWSVAAEALGKALELSPAEVDLHSQQAVVLAQLGKTEAAREHARAAQEIRAAGVELQNAFADWKKQLMYRFPPADLAQTAGRIARAYRQARMPEDSQAWEENAARIGGAHQPEKAN
jgi:tetratricopeptide (TPR) repeat protein